MVVLMVVCPLCHGTKHIRERNGTWRSCECLEKERIQIRVRNSGLGDFLSSSGFKNSRKLKVCLSHLMDLLLSASSTVGLIGGSIEQRWMLAAWLLKEGTKKKSVFACRVYDLIQAQFDNDREIIRQAETCELLWIRMDIHRKHPFFHDTLTDLLLKRTGKATLITGDGSIKNYLNLVIDVEKG